MYSIFKVVFSFSLTIIAIEELLKRISGFYFGCFFIINATSRQVRNSRHLFFLRGRGDSSFLDKKCHLIFVQKECHGLVFDNKCKLRIVKNEAEGLVL